MQILITYDVTTETLEGRRRLRKVARACKNVGQRVQLSVFECTVTETQFEELLRKLPMLINEEEDSLRVYRLLEPKERHVKQFGAFRSVDFEGPLIL